MGLTNINFMKNMKMIDKIMCVVSVTLLVGQFFVILNCSNKREVKDFIEELPEDYREYYKKVMKERMTIYIKATIMGIIFSFGILILGCVINFNNHFYNTCSFTGIALLIQLIMYMTHTKHYTMKHILTDNDLKVKWDNIYGKYKQSYLMGLLVGLIGYFLLGFVLCKFFVKTCSNEENKEDKKIIEDIEREIEDYMKKDVEN